jgi:hypothetical protein
LKSSLALNFGGSYKVYLLKGKKKLDVNSLQLEKLHDFKEFFFGEAAL